LFESAALPTIREIVSAERRRAVLTMLAWIGICVTLTFISVAGAYTAHQWETAARQLPPAAIDGWTGYQSLKVAQEELAHLSRRLATVSEPDTKYKPQDVLMDLTMLREELRRFRWSLPDATPSQMAVDKLNREIGNLRNSLESEKVKGEELIAENKRLKINVESMTKDDQKNKAAVTKAERKKSDAEGLLKERSSQFEKALRGGDPDPKTPWCVVLFNSERGYDARLFEATAIEFHAAHSKYNFQVFWVDGPEEHLWLGPGDPATIERLPSYNTGSVEDPDKVIARLKKQIITDRQRIQFLLVVSSLCPVPTSTDWNESTVHVCCLVAAPNEPFGDKWKEFCNQHGGGLYQEIPLKWGTEPQNRSTRAQVRAWMERCVERERVLTQSGVRQ